MLRNGCVPRLRISSRKGIWGEATPVASRRERPETLRVIETIGGDVSEHSNALLI